MTADDRMTIEEAKAKELLSMDVAEEKQKQLRQLFPEVLTDGKVDFDQLRRVLGDWVEPGKERYGLNWPGKADCMKVIQEPSIATLKPDREESVDFDSTKNLFVEGDNLEVLKLLQKAYFGKIKMIYIDPPYNTGKEFIYPDKYQENLNTYLTYTGQVDDEGKKFSTNTEAGGRYHANWLSMMYPRLYLSRNLLSDDGVIFISIDDHEDANLRNICDTIFGPKNFLAKFAWRTDGNFDNQAKIKRSHEYILCYAKNEKLFPHPPVIDPNIKEGSKLFNPAIRNTIVKNGPKNPVSSVNLPKDFPADFEEGVIKQRTDAWPHYEKDATISKYRLKDPVTVSSGWSSKELLTKFIENDCREVLDQKGQPTKFAITRTGTIEAIKVRSDTQSHVVSSISNLGGPQKGNAELEELGVVFDDYPKPTALLEYLISMNSGDDFFILDFFAGSCSTAHAALNLNKSDSGNRKFIMVQLPEKCDTDTKAFKAGYSTIAEIGKDRIRKVAQNIANDNAQIPDGDGDQELDLGFKVFKLARSNFKVWGGDIEKIDNLTDQLEMHVEHINQASAPEDILYELLLKAGYELTIQIAKKTMAGKDVFEIADGALLICLDKNITPELIDALADADPLQVICLDEGFKGNDQLKANAVQTFKSCANDDEEVVVFRTV